MKRMTWLVPAVLAAANCSGQQKQATYSPKSGGSAMTYSAPNQNGSSQMPAARPQAPAAQPYQAPSSAPVARAAPYVPPPPPPPSAYTPPVAQAPVVAPPPPPPPPAPYVPPAPPAPPPAVAPRMEAPSTPQAFAWAGSLSEAQSTARATGRLVFLETGRDACGNCQNLRRKIVPEVSTELGTMSVGYYNDCDHDQASQAFRILTTNLPNAVTLPLVGWVTPDLRWVHGFSGGRDSSRFRQEMAMAQSKYRQMGALPRSETGPALGLVPAASPSLPAGSLPDAELADIGAELLGEAPASIPAPVAVAAPALATTVPAAPPEGSRDWAQGELRRAADALSARDYTGARLILAEVRTKAAGEPEAREADKGEVAIYNLRLLDRTPTESAKVRDQAQRDLRNTVWAPLFA